MQKKLKQIICAVDFSPHSDKVVAYAADLQQCGAKLTLLHVEQGETDSRCMLKKHLHAFSHYSDILARRGSRALFRVQYGEPAAEILAYAEEHRADLLLLGSHGSMAFTRLLMGSTAESVMRRSICPVVVYKSPEMVSAPQTESMSNRATA
mgnify:CR=1 FL=1